MKDKFIFFSTPSHLNQFYRRLMEKAETAHPKWFGVDWAKDSGMNRGDVIKRDDNIIHVRFRAVGRFRY